MGGEISISGGDAEDEGIIGWEDVSGDDGVVRLGRSMHLREDLLGESLGHPTMTRWSEMSNLLGRKNILVNIGLSASPLDASLFRLSH